MSSTYAHYQGPASLPRDYAVLSQFADREAEHVEETSAIEEQPFEDEHPRHLIRRLSTTSHGQRLSFPAPYIESQNPSLDPYGLRRKPSVNIDETTPLLNPPVPRIEEAPEAEGEPESSAENPIKMFWEEFRILGKYAFPVFGTHLLEYSLVIASVISIGHLSTTALAAISLGSMTASVSGFSVIQGLTSALDTMLPSAWTSSQPQLVGLWTQRMTVIMTGALIPMFLIWFNAEAILLALKQDPDVAHLAAVYLRWVSLGLPAYAFNCISRRYFQSQGLFDVPTRIIFVVAPINALLNYFLVWGPPKLGFIGAPLATAISFNLVSLMSIIYGVFFVPRTAWHPLSRRMFTSLGVLLQLGLAGVGQTASEWWAWELVTLAASLLGPVVLATQSVLLVSASSTYQAPFALGVATSVRIGNLLGDQRPRRAGIASNAALVMAAAFSGISSAMFLVCRNSWGYLFNDDPEVVSLVASVLPLVALFQVFDGNCAVTAGILRARGKQFTGALLNISAYYIIGLPFGIWLAFNFAFGIYGLWIGFTVSLIYCSFFGTWLCLRTDWDHEACKVMERLKSDTTKNQRNDDEERLLQQ
ncbi:hypothetical protein AX16_002490 [Volvariella volvacea WC 439]|nr:hypothetical protein AX16_002490 [Volvariella volvacea WC 439]